MPRIIEPSSFVCDCGAESHHFENTIREMKEMSRRGRHALVADDREHTIIFHHGAFVGMWCPKEERVLPSEKRV